MKLGVGLRVGGGDCFLRTTRMEEVDGTVVDESVHVIDKVHFST